MTGRREMTRADRLLTVAEAADVLSTTERFPRRLIEQRRIRFVRVGRHVRIPESALVLLATFASLRFGELAGLRQGQVDLDGCAVRVVVATAETDDGRLIDDDPKSQAGRRWVAFPKEIAPELRWHLERFAQPGEHGLVFIGPKGGRLRRSTFRRTWTKARNSVDLPDLHFHDLSHRQHDGRGPGREPARTDGADGTPSARAALVYQHATQERDEVIAAGMGKLLRQARRTARAGGGAGTEQPSARNGHAAGNGPREDQLETDDHALTWAGAVRAGEGNRTLMTSLEGWGSAIELRPRCRAALRDDPPPPVSMRSVPAPREGLSRDRRVNWIERAGPGACEGPAGAG